MVYADLHSHTTVSDGETEPSEVTEIASQVGLEAVAITDHDQINTFLDGKLEVIENIDIINGIELRVKTATGHKIDLLGYGVQATTQLENLTQVIQQNRIERSTEMLDLIEDETGVRLQFEPDKNTGRPHIARAIEQDPQLEYSYQTAFDELIGNDCPCYVERDLPLFKEGLYVLQNATEFVSLAHPYRYTTPNHILEMYAEQLDGIESNYPYESKGYVSNLEDRKETLFIEQYSLISTGGSDSHEPTTLGCNGLTQEDYVTFLQSSGLYELSKLSE